MALPLPDPCDECCPEAFKNKARGLLHKVGCGKGVTDQELRRGDPADASFRLCKKDKRERSLRVSGKPLGAQASRQPTKDKAGLFLRMRYQGADRGRDGTGHIMRA